MRGTPEADAKGLLRLRIIPAYAGNTRLQEVQGLRVGDHPRVCGEHDLMVINSLEDLGSSPRMRGTLDFVGSWNDGHGIIPAYAGNTRWM